MGQYCFASWRLSSVVVVCQDRLSSSVTLPVGGPAGRRARGRVGGRVADTARTHGGHSTGRPAAF